MSDQLVTRVQRPVRTRTIGATAVPAPSSQCHCIQTGTIEITDGILDEFEEIIALAAVGRHLRGDWGYDHYPEEKRNEARWSNSISAAGNGTRIISRYKYQSVEFYVVTEADRSQTTVCLIHEL